MCKKMLTIVVGVLIVSACTGSVEWELRKINYEPECNVERVITFTPGARMLLYVEEARWSAEEDERSDEWRCQLFEAAHHARSLPKDSRWDGPVLAINLERAALAVLWFEAHSQIVRAFDLAEKAERQPMARAERIYIRITVEERELIERGAKLEDRSMSDWVRTAIRQRIWKDREVLGIRVRVDSTTHSA